MRQGNHGRSRWVIWARARAAATVCALAATAVAALAAAPRRVEVEGRSMVPTLQPGDRVLVLRLPPWWRLRAGSVVAVRDPRSPDRLLVKRLAAVEGRPAGFVLVAGDNPDHSTDSRTFGPVPRRDVRGIVFYRYAPAGRAGRVG